MGIRLLRGRTFSDADEPKGAPVLIVNEQLARHYFGGADPVGKRVHFGGPRSPNPWMTVIGVVADVLTDRLEQAPRPMLYRPLTQASSLSMAIAVHTTGDPRRLTEALARAVRESDPDQPTHSVRTMEEVQAAATASRRFSMQLLGGSRASHCSLQPSESTASWRTWSVSAPGDWHSHGPCAKRARGAPGGSVRLCDWPPRASCSGSWCGLLTRLISACCSRESHRSLDVRDHYNDAPRDRAPGDLTPRAPRARVDPWSRSARTNLGRGLPLDSRHALSAASRGGL